MAAETSRSAADSGRPAHWLALVRAVPDATHTRASGAAAQANEGDVLLEAHENDLLRATRLSNAGSVLPRAHKQEMQVPELLCVAALVNVWLAECAVADMTRDVRSERM